MGDLIINENDILKYKDKQPPWGFNGLGYVVYKRTYARIIEGLNRTEEWIETIARCINGVQDIGADYTKEEALELLYLMFNLKCSFGGRMLWQLGTSTVKRFGGDSLNNCWFVEIKAIDDFLFLMNELLLGGGVGFSIRREHIHELPKLKKDINIVHENSKDADFIVPDSREGWVNLLAKILKSYLITGKSFTYSTILVRGAGEPIKGFGGHAAGPKILVDGMSNIIQILKSREGKKLRSIDVLDICNIIGSMVIAGNTRRSALLGLGDPDDFLFIRAKRWDLGTIPNWRSTSNNTISADSYKQISDEVWSGYEGNGECYGLFNLPLAKSHGRLKDGPMKNARHIYHHNNDNCEGGNPCLEQTLSDHESCDLVEIFMNNVNSRDELFKITKLLYKTAKVVLSLPYIHPETTTIVHKNMRIGMGATGICQINEDKLNWLDDAYLDLRKFDVEWSKLKGWNPSIKLTTIKPSGTLSLLSGSFPGVHPAYAKFYIRRIRMSSSDLLVSSCRKAGYKVEYERKFDGSEDYSTCVVEFPCSAGDGITAKDMTAIKQLELVKQMQSIWSDNSVSVTVYFKREELPEIKEWLKLNYENSIKSVSFLLHSDHGFDQAPYEEISEVEYKNLTSKLKPIFINDNQEFTIENLECGEVGGACPVR